MSRILTGVQSTGTPHLGNLIGAGASIVGGLPGVSDTAIGGMLNS